MAAVVICPRCQRPVRHWTPFNLGNPADPAERRLAIFFSCCGRPFRARAEMVVTEIREQR